ncbi:zinc-binding dehydrogenase [Microbacterium sp. SSW1-59]|uniref:zinc-binding dehydrogenase n=1 Tax=Microbacterium xanthum TaxID=3079794 RepID=UPI002AD57ACC|nr:zinc-binding dehydrogenase [Microbacterium sp. SSW1-59]MDZ8201310.1 zinc-binding dehydrogenase [Microbacterium sp. SSW1-59]
MALIARIVPGGHLTVVPRERPVPVPTGHDLVVRVDAMGLNPVDLKRAAAEPAGVVPGFDATGQVVGRGPNAGSFDLGDRVFYAGTLDRDGAAQPHHLVDERLCGRAPRGWSAVDTAGLPLTMITAWEALHDQLRWDSSTRGTLLMVGGAGGVGTAVIQLARATLPHVRVIATAARRESSAWARRFGAHDIVDHASALAPQVRRIAPKGVDAVISTASRGRVDDLAVCLAPFGHVVGVDRGPIDVTPLKPLSGTWHWVFMFTKAVPDWNGPGTPHAEILARVAALAETGALRSPTRHVYPRLSPDTLSAALTRVGAGHGVGKTVIRGS